MSQSNQCQKQILSLTEIRQQYPEQWVLVVEPELDENLDIIKGEVVAYSPDRDGLYNQLFKKRKIICD
jgi:hypothetical protein